MKRCIRAVLRVSQAALLLITASCPPIAAAEAGDSPEVVEARALLDSYFGQSSNLIHAQALLESAVAKDDEEAAAYVEAARLVVKGGHIFRDNFRPNTLEAYSALLDKALALDSNNQKAHILKAEVFDIQRDYQAEKQALDRAAQLGSEDPWLWVAYGRYYKKIGDIGASHVAYDKVKTPGPSASVTERTAYVTALLATSTYKLGSEDQREKMKRYAAIALKERDPKDAWTIGSFADKFLNVGMFAECIQYAQEALQTMSYGAGRLIQAKCQYARAAELIENGKDKEAAGFIDAAKALRVNPAVVLQDLDDSGPTIDRLMPILKTIIK